MRRILVVPALVAVLLSGMLLAQQPKPKTFTNADVIKMVKAWAKHNGLHMRNLAIDVLALKYCPRPNARGFSCLTGCG